MNSSRADWQLVWADEFDGASVDSSHWTYDLGNGSGGWGNNELEYYTSRPQNVYVTNGLLHIVALAESYGGQSYTSAKLKSKGLFSKKYGRFEFRARLPQGQGYWPALWMMPQDAVYGGWASSGEIDVVENKGNAPATVMGTLHFGGAWPNNTQSHGPSFTFPAGDSVTNFHTYALEWTTNAISWYVDDQLYETQTSWWSSSNPTNLNLRNPYPAPFDQSFYIIMNLAVGGNFGGNPDGTTVFPGEMQVDYVRVYDGASAPPPPPPPPVLRFRVAFDDPRGVTTTPCDLGGGTNCALQMLNASGAAADLHGLANSGVAGMTTGGRALDLTSNGANQPGNPGPLVAATNAGLGFGSVSNFVAALWFKQNAMMASGANVGPRLLVLGAGAPSDTGVANSIGLKFQTASQLYVQLAGNTAQASFPTNLPANSWLFVAATYDGSTLAVYQGTDTTPASLVGSNAVQAAVDFGSGAALYVGNRQNGQRSFNGWIDDVRFYTGLGDAAFVENVRLLTAGAVVGLSAVGGPGRVDLSWASASGATGYNVKRSTTNGGPYSILSAGTNVTNTAFTDSSAAVGATYYYVVSPLNPAGEGANSIPAGATPSANAPVAVSILPVTNGVRLSWPAGILESATNLAGPWTNVPGAVSPHTATVAVPRQFFRVRVQ